MDWIIGLQKAIDYIENNLTETIDYTNRTIEIWIPFEKK